MATKRLTTLPVTTDRRIDALLTLLAENSTIVISGAKIAKEIGVYAAAGLALDRKTACSRREREGPPAHRLPHRASAGHSGSADAQPSPLRHAFRAPHSPFLQNRFDQHRRHASGRSRRAARRCRPRRRADRRPRPRRPDLVIRKIRRNLLQHSAAPADSALPTLRCSPWSRGSPRATRPPKTWTRCLTSAGRTTCWSVIPARATAAANSEAS